ncbi:DUF3105 domain-containing protein [Candidatus Daviesbacteria bacterium]|nr:DUF3105 domain-containing protein [Candidatus Daviesbacteria bacterium]
MRTETKIVGGVVLATIIILVGGVWLLSSQGVKEQTKLSKPLMGEAIADQGGGHVADGTLVQYNSNPPTSGQHYANPQPAGIYDKPVPDGNLVHSLEHGAVILWYKSDTPATQSAQLKSIFSSVSVSKKIIVPRDNLDVLVALTSWGRLLKFQTIDENQIRAFMETNEDRGPEKAPL